MSSFMIRSLRDFNNVLDGSSFAPNEAIQTTILDSAELAYALPVKVSSVLESWIEAKKLFAKSQFQPIVTTFWSSSGNFLDAFQNEDVFSRFYFEEAPNNVDISPRELLKRSESVDVVDFVRKLTTNYDSYAQAYYEDSITYQLENTLQKCGIAPSEKDIDFNIVNTESKLERWLLNWELKNGGESGPLPVHSEWFLPDNACMLFLPIKSSWEALAYLNWFGTSDFGSEYYIALGKYWEQIYGAELAMHYGTMLQCLVERPPLDIESSWEVASQHVQAGSCTLVVGDHLRDYAQKVMGNTRWFLHERP